MPSYVALQQCRPGEEWLYFLRRSEGNATRLIKSVDLTRPLLRSHTAAINSEGKVLDSRQVIIAAVKSRTALARELPKNCRPESIENSVLKGYEFSMLDYKAFVEPALNFVGGFRRTIDCDRWSHAIGEYGETTDLLITHLVVPADNVQRDWLLASIEKRLKRGGSDEFTASVYALVNYPDETVRKLLRTLAEMTDSGEQRRYALDCAVTAARNILSYWRYSADMGPLSKLNHNETAQKVAGVWRITKRRPNGQVVDATPRYPYYSMQVFLHPDNSLAAFAFDGPLSEPSDWNPKVTSPARWKGTGYWYVSEKRVSATITAVDAHNGYVELQGDGIPTVSFSRDNTRGAVNC